MRRQGAGNPGRRALLAVLGGIGLLVTAPAAHGAGSSWKKLGGKHVTMPRAQIVRLLQKDGISQPEALLKHAFLVRLELRDAGGGAAKHSEVVVRFRSLPGRALAKAWSPGGAQPGRAQLGAWTLCKEKPGAVGKSCPRQYNGQGFVDVTGVFTERNMLFVHDPARKGKGNTVVWFAADRSQEHLFYYVVPRKEWPSFGFGRLAVRKLRVPKPEPPARLPGAPPDPGNGLRPRPDPPVTRPVPPTRPDPPVTQPVPLPRPASKAWTSVSDLHRGVAKDALRRRLRQDGVAYPDYLLKHRYLVRLALTDAGGGSRSRTELQLRFLSQPTKAVGKAWADQPGLQRGQIGAEDLCQPRPAAEGGPESKRCPVHFGGLGWRNLITAFRSVRMRLVVDPNNNDQGHMVLWLAFDHAQTGMAYRLVERAALPSLGDGKVAVELLTATAGASPGPGPGLDPGPDPAPRPAPEDGWKPLGRTLRALGREALATRMRRDGVAQPSHLLKNRYVVRLAISGAGGAQSQRSEVVVRLSGLPRAALGTAWSDHRRSWGAQMGALSRCRPLPKPRNPYGEGDGWQRQPKGHVCPLQYNGLGWRNLVSAFTETDVMFITAPWRAAKGNQILWLGFDQAPTLKVRSAVTGVGLLAKVRAEAFEVGAGAATPPGADPGPAPGPADPADPGPPADPGQGPPQGLPNGGWITQPGTHLQVDKNTLYWTIHRDGFKNPWHLLKARYLVRLEVTGGAQRAETLVRFAAAPREVIGTGRGSHRSATQVGTPQACRKAAGQPAYCPLHYANIGWRNLAGGLRARTLFFVTDPGRGGGAAPRTVLWLAFDSAQDSLALRHVTSAPDKANVKIKRFRW